MCCDCVANGRMTEAVNDLIGPKNHPAFCFTAVSFLAEEMGLKISVECGAGQLAGAKYWIQKKTGILIYCAQDLPQAWATLMGYSAEYHRRVAADRRVENMLDSLIEAMRVLDLIARSTDEDANEFLRTEGSFAGFDEPNSVEMARDGLLRIRQTWSGA